MLQKAEAYLLVLAQFLGNAIQNHIAMVMLKTLFWLTFGFCEQIPGAKLLSFGRVGRDLGSVTVDFFNGF